MTEYFVVLVRFPDDTIYEVPLTGTEVNELRTRARILQAEKKYSEYNERQRKAREAARERREREKARENSSRYNFTFSSTADSNTSWDDVWRILQETSASFSTASSNFHQAYGSPRASQGAPNKSPLIRLHELAEVAYPSNLDNRKLYRRAARYCHSDQGGTKEKWEELDRIARKLGIIK